MQEEQRKSRCPQFPGSVSANSVVTDTRRKGGGATFNLVEILKPAPKTLNGLFPLFSIPLRTTDSQTLLVWVVDVMPRLSCITSNLISATTKERQRGKEVF